jgi:hypothetical protein
MTAFKPLHGVRESKRVITSHTSPKGTDKRLQYLCINEKGRLPAEVIIPMQVVGV